MSHAPRVANGERHGSRASAGVMRRSGSFYTDKTYPYVMPQSRSIDIDTIEDMRLAEFLMAAE